MRHLLCLLLLLCFTTFAASLINPAHAQEENSSSDGASGLPIPRFVALRFEEVNVRTGPGTRYPIRWVYKRKLMPMEIIEEFEQWRKIRDVQGDDGWVHKSQLSGNRTGMFKEPTTLLRYAQDTAPPLVKVSKNVIGKFMECNESWCRIQVDSFKGWTHKDRLWGVYPKETFE